MMIHESKWLSVILISLFLPAFAVAASGSTKDYTWLLFLKVNKPPQVDAGGNQTITNNSTTLVATVTDDPTDTLSYQWAKISGPGNADFSNEFSKQTLVTFSKSGTYVLGFTADDGQFEESDTVQVTVSNTAPQINAGPDRQITDPTNSLYLDASVSDNENNVQTIAWTKVSGPGSVAFSNPSSVDTNVSFGAVGTYELRLSASDWEYIASDTVKVDYLPQPSSKIDVVVVVGDSIEVGLGDNDCTMCVAWLVDNGTVPPQETWSKECTGYTVPLAQKLSGAPGFASSVDVRERGMSGAFSYHGVNKIGAFVQNNPDADVFLIGYGTNDAGADVPAKTFRSNIKKIIEAVMAKGMEPIVAYIPYVKFPKTALNTKIQQYNTEIFSLTGQYNLRSGPSFYAHFFNNQSQLNDKKEWCKSYGSSYYTDDGVHPNHTGYSNMAQMWADVFK